MTTTFTYAAITSAFNAQVEQVGITARQQHKAGHQAEAVSLSASLWGGFRLWERITVNAINENRLEDAMRFEEQIRRLQHEIS